LSSAPFASASVRSRRTEGCECGRTELEMAAASASDAQLGQRHALCRMRTSRDEVRPRLTREQLMRATLGMLCVDSGPQVHAVVRTGAIQCRETNWQPVQNPVGDAARP
jgi:hypothetical protein